VLYNDCFSDENVQVEVRLESKGKLITNDFHNFAVPLGEHRDFKIEFTVPENIDNKLDLVLITRKNGKLTFREKRSFFSVPGSAGRPAIKPHIKIIT
jgi:hypothetical protein